MGPNQVSRMGWPPLTLVHVGGGQYAPMMVNPHQWTYPSQYGQHMYGQHSQQAQPPQTPYHPNSNPSSFMQSTRPPQISVIETERQNLLSEENFPPLVQTNKIHELPTNLTAEYVLSRNMKTTVVRYTLFILNF